jgi:hypothetical protein
VKRTKPLYWILLPVFLLISGASFWAGAHYGPLGKSSTATQDCANLRILIVAEEAQGKPRWQEYRSLVSQLGSLPENSAARAPLVEEIAGALIEVLGHDLTIYKELNRYPSCVLMDKRKDIPTMIKETESAINFLNGSQDIDGNFFDPNLGVWNSSYYAEYLSAIEFLKGSTSSSASN